MIGKYYLVDSGYPNTVGYMCPIRLIRYHIPEYKKSPPKGMLENFNYQYSSLRMSIKCAFGHLKKRWKVLHNMPQMSEKYQMSIIVATCTLHNFIKMHKLGIPIVQHEASVCGSVDVGMFDDHQKAPMFERRKALARLIWKDVKLNDAHEADGEDNNEDEVEENDEVADHMEEDY
ncbi:uncharacterized protein LOC104906771 [Beta vulgaris subsp. vulgaris]|uniref:uncharacterized protein LOC104906771 n=1 Tax=Beta vulgaris subsp. vulgaris TaxID=3555 RepID=UPI000540080A|nr:uncharacterized protein LOC104906771 [Beta vulgaris subsp. vulgaris]